MPDVNDIHRFYEANLPGYERSDILQVTRFFIELMGLDGRKPYKSAWKNWKRFKKFVCMDWQGTAEKPPGYTIQSDEEMHKNLKKLYCQCGGVMKVRINSKDGSKFLGCSKYPRCKQTQNL